MTLKDIIIAGKLTISEGGGGGTSVLQVTFTTDWATGTADKSYSEIMDAFNAGAFVYGYDTGQILNLVFIDESGAQFQTISVDYDNDYMINYDVFIDSTDACSFSAKSFSLTPM